MEGRDRRREVVEQRGRGRVCGRERGREREGRAEGEEGERESGRVSGKFSIRSVPTGWTLREGKSQRKGTTNLSCLTNCTRWSL